MHLFSSILKPQHGLENNKGDEVIFSVSIVSSTIIDPFKTDKVIKIILKIIANFWTRRFLWGYSLQPRSFKLERIFMQDDASLYAKLTFANQTKRFIKENKLMEYE